MVLRQTNKDVPNLPPEQLAALLSKLSALPSVSAVTEDTLPDFLPVFLQTIRAFLPTPISPREYRGLLKIVCPSLRPTSFDLVRCLDQCYGTWFAENDRFSRSFNAISADKIVELRKTNSVADISKLTGLNARQIRRILSRQDSVQQ